jgi:hypothetical protein
MRRAVADERTTRRTQPRREPKKPFQLLDYETAVIGGVLAQKTPTQRRDILLAVRQYIAQEGFFPDAHGNYLDLIDGVARIIDGKGMEESKRELDALEAFIKAKGIPAKMPSPRDTATELALPQMHAALAIGFTLGLALAHNGGGDR